MKFLYDVLRRYRVQPEPLLCHTVSRHTHIPWSHAAACHGSLTARPSSERHPGKRHHHGAIRWVKITKIQVEQAVRLTQKARMLDLGSNFVVNDCLLILANNVDTKLKMVLGLELMWVGLPVFR